MRTQLNIYVDGNIYVIPGFDGFVPHEGEKVLMQGHEYRVEEIIYEFTGTPLTEAHINVGLTDMEAPVKGA
jgi:hypothetical protein